MILINAKCLLMSAAEISSFQLILCFSFVFYVVVIFQFLYTVAENHAVLIFLCWNYI